MPAISMPFRSGPEATTELGAGVVAAAHPAGATVGAKPAGAAHVRSSKSAVDMTAAEAAAHVATPATEAASHMATATATVATTATATTVATSAATTATATARQGISRDGGCAKRDRRNQDDYLV
jgi:hypothetical protein